MAIMYSEIRNYFNKFNTFNKEKTVRVKIKDDFSIMKSECIEITLKAGEYDFATAKEQYEKINEEIKAPFRETFEELVKKFPSDFETIYSDLKFTINADLSNFKNILEKFNEEKTMKVRVKKDFCVMHNGIITQIPKGDILELRRGLILIIPSAAKTPNILVDTDPIDITKFVKDNNEFLEIIEDWKPIPLGSGCYKEYYDPGVEKRLREDPMFCYHLSKKEKALRKLRQIEDYLNGDWNEKESFNRGDFYGELVYHCNTKAWGLSINRGFKNAGTVCFRNTDNPSKTVDTIISYMNNGDGVCMNDLLED